MNDKKLITYKFDLIREINKYRNSHGVRSLKSDYEIDREAQYLADRLSQSGHRYRIKSLDETVYQTEMYLSPTDLAQILYNENADYNYESDFPEPSNFTRMVWKSSDLIGIGICRGSDKKYTFVIKYFPTGNNFGEFRHNVFPFGTKYSQAFYVKKDHKNLSDKKQQKTVSNKTPTATKPSPTEINEFYKDALDKHNYYRRVHHVGPLTINNSLCRIAESYSRILAYSIRSLVHSKNKYNREPIGENLYYCKGKEPTGSHVTSNWYEEIQEHDFNSEWGNVNTGHFTQVVWKGTKEVGFGVTKNENGQYFVVANYFPAGNVIGTYKENVLVP